MKDQSETKKKRDQLLDKEYYKNKTDSMKERGRTKELNKKRLNE